MQDPHRRKWLTRAITRPPYRVRSDDKGWLNRLTRAPAHVQRLIRLSVAGWPTGARPLRIAFLSDFHLGSHAGDLARLERIVVQAAAARPDLVLLGGDFVNMMIFGGGRIPPDMIAERLARLPARIGHFAVLGNHDYTYGAREVAAALRRHGIVVLDDQRHELRIDGGTVDLIGIPDARHVRPAGRALLEDLARPSLILAHDPFWFAHVPAGPHLMLAGHTHGGQIRLPLIGPVRNASRAPWRWTYGLVQEGGRHLYVTSGLGCSGAPIRFGIAPESVILDVDGTPADQPAAESGGT